MKLPRRSARRGVSLMWVIAALGLAAAMTPLYVSLCRSLSRVTARNAHRLVACQRGGAEMERLRGAEHPLPELLAVPQLPEGKERVSVTPGPTPSLVTVSVELTWSEDGTPARAAWTTLMRK